MAQEWESWSIVVCCCCRAFSKLASRSAKLGEQVLGIAGAIRGSESGPVRLEQGGKGLEVLLELTDSPLEFGDRRVALE